MSIDTPELTVLLVEDNPGDARLIRVMLSEAAAHPAVRLVHVERLEAARERLRQPGIDVVLLDLGLPDSQGLDTFVLLRHAAPQFAVVVLSGQSDASLGLHAVQEGAQDYLVKGKVDSEVLVRALRYAFERKQIEERQRFLSEAGRTLAGSLDYEATLERVVQLPVPVLADASVLVVSAGTAAYPRVVAHGTDALRAARLRATATTFVGDALEVQARLCELGFASHQVRELRVLGRRQGTLWLLRGPERPTFSKEDVDLLDEFTLRAALALDNARLHHELRAAVRLRDEVLAWTAHDLRSPLTGIKLQGVLLRKMLAAPTHTDDAPLHARVVAGLDDIDAAIGRSLGLIQELLDAAALTAGRQLQLDRKPTDLVDLARRAVADYQARTDFHQLRVCATEPALVGHWDPIRLGRVLDNLLSNALKYTPRPETIHVRLGREADSAGNCAVVSVSDPGVGIPAAELQYVFDPFYRGSNVAEMRGAGVGLSGVRQIVEQHGGRISVLSTEGAGSTFTVRLPLDETCG